MAAMRVRTQPAIGSAQWVNDENAQVSVFCDQEAEDFTFAARNEVEWLNEHMAEILSKTEMNVADAFKTPGKLRGKTPRTIRKRNPLEPREPLSDIFSTNARSTPLKALQPNQPKSFSPDKRSFKVAEDASLKEIEPSQGALSKTDSGYHGLPEDEMEIDHGPHSPAETHDTLDDFPHSPTNRNTAEVSSTDNSTTERSFHSAREDITKKDITTAVSGDVQEKSVEKESVPNKLTETARDGQPKKHSNTHESLATEAIGRDESGPSSEESSPVHGLVRKSSLTFASLPAREPITTKKSIGNRLSRTSQLDQYKTSNFQNGLIGRLTGGKSLGGMKQSDVDNKIEDDENPRQRPQLSRDESDSDSRMTKLHNKSSTQRLHERINLLGKSQPPRPNKSIPSLATSVQPAYPELPRQNQQKAVFESAQPTESSKEDDDDDWIQPPQPSIAAQSRPQLTKSISADVIDRLQGKEASDKKASESQSNELRKIATSESSHTASKKDHKLIPSPDSENNPPRFATQQSTHSTTPLGSPNGRDFADGPLSASKSRLQSIMKTAKGLFSSSGSASAQAKLDVLSPSEAVHKDDYFPSRSAIREGAADEVNARSHDNHVPAPGVFPAAEPRKTRSSTEKEAREKEKEALEIEQAEREKETVLRQESAIQSNAQIKEKLKETGSQPAKPIRQSPRKTQQREQNPETDQMARSLGPNQEDQCRQSQVHRMKDVRRPAKPTKEAPAQQKAPPVNIRIGMPSRRVPLNNSAISSTLQDSLPPQSKQPGLTKKGSNASIQSSVIGTNNKSSAPAPKPKALIAAERKKEQDEREAQRKMEQKREMERRRAAQQEETRRQEQHQRQEAEKQKEKDRVAAADDSRKQAQRQAIEKRRLDMQKKDQRPVQRPAHDHQNANNAGATHRAELGGNRPPSRQANPQDQHRPTASHQGSTQNKAPIKRVFDPESDAGPSRPAKPRTGQGYQQQDSKRRRTNEDEPEEFPMRPTKAPPIRQSGIRNGPKASVFGQSYSTAPPPAAHHAGSLIRSATTNQAYQQHLYQNQQSRQGHTADTSKYQDGNKIPFAENPNPPHHRPTGQPQPFKTPLPTKLAQPTRQSPHYPHGEHIQLQEIPTDSEDSDSSPDTAQKRQRTASLPEWVQSPYLNNLLRNQEEYMDPDAVFGPVGSPHLEEMFRERAHKFRSRTSSANWAGQDRLTQDEIRRDAEARARIRREGGWTYGGTT